jgi:hypothetical protein
MGRTLDDVIASLPRFRQINIEARYQTLRRDIQKSLKRRRKAANALAVKPKRRRHPSA